MLRNLGHVWLLFYVLEKKKLKTCLIKGVVFVFIVSCVIKMAIFI